MTLAPGARLGPYAVIGPLGSGGMGEVHRARDDRLGREVAVKVLPAEVEEEVQRILSVRSWAAYTSCYTGT